MDRHIACYAPLNCMNRERKPWRLFLGKGVETCMFCLLFLILESAFVLVGIWTGTCRAAYYIIVVLPWIQREQADVFIILRQLNRTRQHFRQIVESLREKTYSRYLEDLRHWEYLFNGLVLRAVEYSVLGIKSWLCHINPKEEAAFSCTAPGAEAAPCRSSVTAWSLYSPHPSGERSQH